MDRYFGRGDLDTNRNHLTRDFGSEGNTSNRAQWNERLLEHGVGPLWARLIQRLGRHQYELPKHGYSAWAPAPRDDGSLDSALSTGFYKAAAHLAVMCVRSGDGYDMRVPDGSLRYLPPSIGRALQDGLIADGVNFYEPRPPAEVRQGLKSHSVEVEVFTPDDMRAHFDEMGLMGNTCGAWDLDDAPSAVLQRRERLDAAWAFFARSSTSVMHLIDAPLCLTFEERLRCFDKANLIYTCTSEQEELLKALPHRRLHPDCRAALKLGGREDELGVSPIDVDKLPALLAELVARHGDITDDWAAAALDDLVRRPTNELDAEFDTLHELPLLPTRVGTRTPLGYWQTAALMTSDQDAPVGLLEKLGVPIVRGAPRLNSSVAAALAHYPPMVNELTPYLTARVLAGDHNPWFNPPTHSERLEALSVAEVKELLTYLARAEWDTEDNTGDDIDDDTDPVILSELRQRLPLLASNGTLTRADAGNVYRPTGARPPAALESGVVLLDVGGERWPDLAAALGVPGLDDATLMLEQALPFLDRSADDAAKGHVRLWVLRHAPGVLGEFEERDERAKRLRRALCVAPLLPLRTGGVGAADAVYRADANDDLERLIRVLGPSIAVVPVEPPFGLEDSEWSAALGVLRVPRQPRASDILSIILDASTAWPEPESREPAQEQLRGTYAYLNEPGRLENLKEERLTRPVIERATKAVCAAPSGSEDLAKSWATQAPKLVTVLKALRWLPAQPRLLAGDEDDFTRRLFAPTELHPPSQRPLVGVVRPVLALAEPNKGLREHLGLLSASAAEMDKARAPGAVGEQLYALLQRDPGGLNDAQFDDFGKGVSAVYSQLASLADPQTAMKTWRWPHDGAVEMSVLVEREWRHPSTVFFNRLRIARNPWIEPLPGGDERASAQQRPLLETIGVRDLPGAADWTRLLAGLHELLGDRPLTGAYLALANDALRALATELRDTSLDAPARAFVLSDADGLIDASASYELNSARLHCHRDRLSLPLIKREEDNRRVAHWAGVRPVSEVIDLGNPQGTVVEDYFEPDQARALLQLVAHHPDTWGGLVARLRYHYATKSSEDEYVELSTVREWEEEAVLLTTELSITVYETLTVELSFLDIDHRALSLAERYVLPRPPAS